MSLTIDRGLTLPPNHPIICLTLNETQENTRMAKTQLSSRDQFLDAVKSVLGDIESISRAQIIEVCERKNLKWPAWLVNDASARIGRGMYALKPNASTVERKPAPVVVAAVPAPVAPAVAPAPVEALAAMAASAVQLNVAAPVNLVPEKTTGYVPFGNFTDVRQILKSGKFYPMYITGLSGNGKTMMVEQVCAAEKREMIRVNITIETDEDDLIGGFRLIDGKTVWQNGPVVVAMERGAVLLLDEVDLGSNKMMCLQPVLEGKPIYLKKINKVITPMPGFTIVATANTKGKGSEDGRFIGTNVQNEAFLERFSITMEQEYPSIKVEQKILNNVLAASGIADPSFTDRLVQWADVIRKSFYEGAVSEIISTRRLVHICEAFAIFNRNREKSIELCLNRFDVDTKTSFLDLYKKLDETITPPAATEVATPTNDEVAF
jgi:hypothetical protein